MSPLRQDSNGNFRTDMPFTYLHVQSSLGYYCWNLALRKWMKKNISEQWKRREGRRVAWKEANLPILVTLMKEETHQLNKTQSWLIVLELFSSTSPSLILSPHLHMEHWSDFTSVPQILSGISFDSGGSGTEKLHLTFTLGSLSF